MTQPRYWPVLGLWLLTVGVTAARAEKEPADAPELIKAPRCCPEEAAPSSCCPRGQACSTGSTCASPTRVEVGSTGSVGCEANPTCCARQRAGLVTKTYPVADLLLPVADVPPSGWLPLAARSVLKPAGGEEIVKILVRHIQPHSWNELGGSGTIDYFPLGRALVVTQTPEVHEQVKELLLAMRSLVLRPAMPASGPVTVFMAAPWPVPAAPAHPAVTEFLPPSEACPAGAVCPSVAGHYLVAPEQLPMPTVARPVPPPAPVPVAACGVASCAGTEAVRPACRSWSVRAANDKGQWHVEMRHEDGSCLRGHTLRFQLPGGCCLELQAANGQVAITGPFGTAVADSLSRPGLENQLVLEGRVRFMSQKGDLPLEVTGERVCVDFAGGKPDLLKVHGTAVSGSSR